MSGRDQNATTLSTLQILMVEDSPSDRLMTSMALAEAGVPHELHVIEYGIDTLRFLRREAPHEQAPRPDLILLDLNLPGMDGRDLLRRIKADPGLRSIPVVVLTTSAAPTDLRSAYDNHANCYLRKPTDYDQFVSLAREFMTFWGRTVLRPPPPDTGPIEPATHKGTHSVLLVEDSPSDALLFQTLLAEFSDASIDVVHVDRITAALGSLERRAFDLIFSDLNLPDAKELEAVRLLVAVAPHTPLVVLTNSYADVGEAVLSAGADDFLPKDDLSAIRLNRVLRHTLRRRQLQQSELQAQRVQTVGRLAAGVAHDMNNLLAAIQLTVELLPTGTDDQSSLTKEIIGNIERGRALTRQLLSFGRNGSTDRSPAEVNGAVTSAASLLSRLLRRTVSLDLRLTNERTEVLADVSQLEQVVVNLGINANDAMPDGGTLTIATRVVELTDDDPSHPSSLFPGQYVEIQVRDTGRGIPDELLPHIFEPFFTTKGVHEGTGLGLMTVQEIIRLHAGAIMVSNGVEGGACFTAYLPRYAEPVGQPSLMNKARRTPAMGMAAIVPLPPARASVGVVRVLVAEDDPSIARALDRILSRHGYVVQVAGSADDAWQIWSAQDGAFDVLVTDVIMPGAMTAADLIERTRRMTPTLPVVVCSGYASSAEIEVLEAMKNVTFVPKPFQSEQLVNALDASLRAADQHRAHS